jgi:hypothetical protein
MKTTIDIPDPLLREARKLASRDGITLRELFELALRRVIAEKKETRPFRLRKASFKGRGLHPDMQGADWDQFLEKIYEDRGR